VSGPPAGSDAGEADEVVLRAIGIEKSYGAVRALKGVDFEIRRGKVTVLFGENGAGKSTLMKALAGIERASAGRLELDGELYDPESTTDAVARGISIIHQELNLCTNLSVRDNIFVGRELRRRGGVIDYGRENEIARQVMNHLEEEIDPDTKVSELRLGQQQLVEIARALSMEARILIMDEPTSALSATEAAVLFRVIRELTARGVAVVYISHHLEEAIAIADHAVVLRDGNVVAVKPAEEIDFNWVVTQMVGSEQAAQFARESSEFGARVLSIQDLEVPLGDGSGRRAVDRFSVDVHAGEVVCLYGLMGAGRTELLEAVAGRGEIVGGRILLGDVDVTDLSIPQRLKLGLGLVPEDRQQDGLVPVLSIGSNLSLSSLLTLLRRRLISRPREREEIESEIDDLGIKTSGRDMPISSLSGGNQQKVVIGKVLMTRPKALLLDEPSRGIDVGAKAEIFNLIFRKAAEGYAVLYATSEVSEALAASHRLIVMSKGRFVTEFDAATTTREDVMRASGESLTTVESGGGQ
jgi:erythritol transport system ATP-binding protein